MKIWCEIPGKTRESQEKTQLQKALALTYVECSQPCYVASLLHLRTGPRAQKGREAGSKSAAVCQEGLHYHWAWL
jgi:hypothetical protein